MVSIKIFHQFSVRKFKERVAWQKLSLLKIILNENLLKKFFKTNQIKGQKLLFVTLEVEIFLSQTLLFGIFEGKKISQDKIHFQELLKHPLAVANL